MLEEDGHYVEALPAPRFGRTPSGWLLITSTGTDPPMPQPTRSARWSMCTPETLRVWIVKALKPRQGRRAGW